MPRVLVRDPDNALAALLYIDIASLIHILLAIILLLDKSRAMPSQLLTNLGYM
jgi:hypothetical protein